MDLFNFTDSFINKFKIPEPQKNFTYELKIKNPPEDLKIEKRIKLFIKYFDILSPDSKLIVINKIKNYSNENLTFDKDLQFFINQIDEKFNWNILGSFINNIKYKNFILFIESLYRQSIFIRINNEF
jgi:hypothetical protein